MRITSRLHLLDDVATGPASGVFWSFDVFPSTLPFLGYWGGTTAAALALHWAAGATWLLSGLLTGVPAAIFYFALGPAWQGLILAQRRRMALSRSERLRKLARCNAHLIAYHRRQDGTVSYVAVMTFNRLLQTPAGEVRAQIRNAIRGLRTAAQFHATGGARQLVAQPAISKLSVSA